jgi:predicted nucleotidyltransferase
VAFAIQRALCANQDQKQDTMSTETDFQLTANQWDMLRALRPTSAPVGRLNRYVLDQLVEIGLVAMADDVPALTATGRAVVLRGCPKLWDLAA